MTARRFMMSGASKALHLIGAAVGQTGSTLSFPNVASAGDLVVVMGYGASPFNIPPGFNPIYTGSTQNSYRICTGGESSCAAPGASPCRYTVMHFRPVGGEVSLVNGVTQTPPQDSLSVGSVVGPGILVGCGSIGGATSAWFTTPADSGRVVLDDSPTTVPSTFISCLPVEPGATVPSTRIYPGSNLAIARQTFGLFHVV